MNDIEKAKKEIAVLCGKIRAQSGIYIGEDKHAFVGRHKKSGLRRSAINPEVK